LRIQRGLVALMAVLAIVVGACTGQGTASGGAATQGGTQVAGSPSAVATSPAATSPAATSPAASEPAATTPGTESPSASVDVSASPGDSGAPSGSPAGSGGQAGDFKACEVSDTGGIDDKGFNANAYKGLEDAARERGIEIAFLESQAATDYPRNIQTFMDQQCDMIVTVGFLLGDATKAAAEANPEQKFAIVDFAYDPTIPNVLGLTFKTDEAAMLAGYLAAGMSKSGKIGTFGGINIPPVTIFMDGLAAGVNYYNEQKGANVELLGWDPANPEAGVFTGDFEDKDKGRQTAEGFIQEGADIIVPVAGPVGLGAAAAVQNAKDQGVMLIGVDTDQYESAPEYGDVTLTSILKRIDNAVHAAIDLGVDEQFEGGVYVGTLANEGVGLAPFHDFEDDVPQELKTEIDTLREAIVSGEVKVEDNLGR
jgi:basic membrane protein A